MMETESERMTESNVETERQIHAGVKCKVHKQKQSNAYKEMREQNKYKRWVDSVFAENSNTDRHEWEG